MEIEPNRLYTVGQVAEHLSRSSESVRRLVRLGYLPGRKIGRQVYILGADLLSAGTQPRHRPSAEPAPAPAPTAKSKPKAVKRVDGWRPMGHELKANGGQG